MSGHGHSAKAYKTSTQDLVVMIMTFIVGFCAGFYLYVTAFAPEFDEFIGQTEEAYTEFVIEGSQYGGDRAGTAPSFQVLENGSYRYLPYVQNGEVTEAKEGKVPGDLLNEVKQVLTQEALEIAGATVVRGDCMSYVDGLDYTYDITLDGTDYTLDTCTTALTTNSMIGTTLDKLWNYFETLE